jgi:hypothetical protein
MFDPARLRTTARPSRSSTPASIEAVVVFPFVAEISATPPPSRSPRCAMARRSTRSSSRPGTVVPPRPARLIAARTSRASPTASRSISRPAP